MKKSFRNLHLLQLLLLAIFPAISQCDSQNHCGSTRLEPSQNSSFLTKMILCKSDSLYFRTSLGLLPISSINYSTKHVVVTSHTSCSSSAHFLSPRTLSAGFPRPPGPNSLLLFNCAVRNPKFPLFRCDYGTELGGSCDSSSSCLGIEDADELGEGFHPAQMKCTHYSRVFRERKGLEIGTRVSFDVPDHVPNPCDECGKRDGNCGAGLRCVCHPMKCKDKVITGGAAVKSCGSMLLYLVIFLFIMASYHGL